MGSGVRDLGRCVTHLIAYRHGVFEGIRFYNDRVFKLDEHLQRLYDSAKAIRLEIPLKIKEFEEVILETIRRNNLHDGYIRAVITRGPGDKSPRTFVSRKLEHFV